MTHVTEHEAGTPCWFDLMTPDPSVAQTFYSALFGWTYSGGAPDDMPYFMANKNGKTASGMGPLPSDAPYPTCWTVYFATADCDATCSAIKSAGGSVSVPAMDVLDAGRMAICADPTGAVFGLWQPKDHRGAQVIREHGAMVWCEVNSTDAVKATAFYSQVFGLETRKMQSAPAMDYYTLHKGEGAAAGALQMDAAWGDAPPHFMVYFNVDNTDVALETIAKNGGKVIQKPTNTPFGRMAVVRDPLGATFSIIQSPAQ